VYQRVKNLGNYETERVEVEVHVNEGENADRAFKAAKKYVDGKLKLGPTTKQINDAIETLNAAGVIIDDDDDFDDGDCGH
jgi:hypothetical protein